MNKFKFVLGCLSLSILLVLTSCKIGLGSAVDTEAPEIEILTPSVGVVIRDSFSIGGTWSDDGDIKDLKVKDAKKNGLTVTLKRTDGTTTPTTFISTTMELPASTEEKGKWSCVIDPSKAGENWIEGESTLLDGEYEAVVTITDTYEHKTEKSVTFTIDNTKPVVVLQRPSSRKDGAPDSYGQSFTLEGQAADDNNVNKIEISIYSDPACTGEPLDTVTLNNVPPTISLDVAKYAENPVEKEELAYSKIYGSKPQGAKQLYCKIKAYDGSQRYPVDGTPQSAEDKNGNFTDFYYLYEEIATPVLSKFKITEIYQMYSGTYKGDEKDVSLRSANIDSVKDILEKDGAKITVGTFSLNPENNPTFTVSGKDQLKKDGKDFTANQDYYISNGNSVVVEVSVGLDAIPLIADSLKVYAVECDANGKALSGAGKIYLKSTATKSGTSYKFVTPLSTATSSLELGKNYIFGVDGTDQNNSPVMPTGNGFGFHFAASGSAPILNITNPSNSMTYVKGGDALKVEGSTIVEDGVPTITVMLENKVVDTKEFKGSDAIADGESKKYNFSFTIPASKFTGTESAEFTLTVKSTNDGLNTSESRKIMYDRDKPKLDYYTIEPSPVTYGGHTNAINEKVRIVGSVSDTWLKNQVASVKWELIQNGTVKLSDSIENSFDFYIDTTAVEDDTEATLRITATDQAGNSEQFDKVYFIDQDSDKPTLISKDGSWQSGIYNVNYLTAHISDQDRINILNADDGLECKVTDDDGDVNVTFTVEPIKEDTTKTDATDKTEITYLPDDSRKIEDERKTSTVNNVRSGLTAEHLLPAAGGLYKITIKVTDNTEKHAFTEESFIVKLTSDRPDVTVKNETEYISENVGNKLKISITVDTGDPNFTITRREYKADETYYPTEVSPAGGLSGMSMFDEFKPEHADVNNKIAYSVIDTNGGETITKTITYKIDNTPPSDDKLTITSPTNNIIDGANFTFGGKVEDGDIPSGSKESKSDIAGIYYVFTKFGEAAPTDISKWTYQTNGSGSWNINIELGTGPETDTNKNTATKLYEGHYNLHLYSIDNAGNISSTKTKEFYVDQGAPVITTWKDSEELKVANSTLTKSYDFKFKIEESYGLSSDPVFTVKKDGADFTAYTVYEEGDDTNAYTGKYKVGKIYTVKFTEPVLDGLYEYGISATDNANRLTTVTREISLDTQGPVLSVISPDLDGYQLTEKITINGSSEDASGTLAVYYSYGKSSAPGTPTQDNIKDSDEWIKIGWTATEGTTSSWKIKDLTGTDGDAKNLFIYAVDKNGTLGALLSSTVKFDLTSPSLDAKANKSGSTTKVESLNTNGSFTLAGSVYDKNAIKKIEITDGTNTYSTEATDETKKITISKGTLANAKGSGTAAEWLVNFTITNTRTAGAKENELSDGSYNFKVTVTDSADKTTTKEINVLIDTIAPQLSFNKNDFIPKATKTIDSKDWYGSKAIKFKVSLTELNVDKVEAKTADESSSCTFTPTSTENEYEGSLSLKEGANTINVTVTDKAGNTKTASTTVYVDTVAPVSIKAFDANGNEISGTKLSDGTAPLDIYIETEDAGDESVSSGIQSVDTATTAESNGRYKVTIPANKQSGKYSVKIKDNCNNEITLSPFAFKLDNKAPKVTLSTPTESDATAGLNGKITISGSATDALTTDNGEDGTLNSIKIEYSLDNTNWYQLDSTKDNITSTNSRESFSVEHTFSSQTQMLKVVGTELKLADDTTTVSQEVYVKVTVKDEANHSTTATRTIKVDRDSDRPEIKFSTLNLGNGTEKVWLKNQTTLSGVILDDDGIKDDKFYISLDNSTWKDVTVSSGAWSYDLTNFQETGTAAEKEEATNGDKTIYFKVIDNEDNTYISKASDADFIDLTVGTIKLSDGTNTRGTLSSAKTASSTILSLTVDTLPPAVEITGVKIDGDADFTTSASSLKFGGTKDKFILKVSARDGVGLKDSNPITATASFKSGTTTVTSVDATVAAESGNSYLLTFALSNANKTALLNAKYDDNAEIKVTVEDKAGNKQNATANLSADFKKPEITISAPSSTQYSSGNITAYGTIDSTTTMYYAVSLDNTTTPGADASHLGTAITSWKKSDGTTGTGSVNVKPYYTQINGNSLQWFVYFDDGSTTDTATHDVSFKKYLVNYGITTEELIANKTFKDIVQLYLWVKAVDESGNETVEKYLVLVDPQGDAPKVTIDYPEEDGTTLGGTVTLRGTATDTIGNNIGVDSVWLQIIPNSDGTTFAPTMNDVKLWVDNGYDVYQNTSGNKITSVTGSTASGANYYIKATFSGSAWNLKINGRSEFNPASGSTKNIAYRIYAKDKDGNLSNYEQQYSIFDSDNPVISELYLRQYSNNDAGTGTVVASQAYEDDMWVKGTWWLYGIVQDTQGLSSLTVDGIAQTIKGTANAEEEFKYKLETGGTDNAGSVSVTIEAQDKVDQGATPHKAERTLTINFDNKAPELITSGSSYKIDTAVRNSNGFYSFGSQVTEDAVSGSAQSGFSYLAFWFERNISGGKHVVYDVMRSKSNSEVTYSGLTKENGLMWKSKTVTRDDSALGTLKVSAKDDNIHVGGLCKIGGTIYIISSVSSDGKTININGQPEKSYTTALFAIANVVDNTIESARGAKSSADGQYGYYTTISNDDGDHMVESVEKSGTTWTWEANINSQNIADGTVTLHYVAFDKAGNYKEGTVSGNVENNAPRLASLKVWSDFNENETEDEGEFETYYYMEKEYKIGDKYQNRASDITKELIVSGNKKDYNEGGSAFMTIKAATTFTPEIVGGNGALYYSYKNGASSALSSATVKYGAATIGNGTDNGIDEEIDNTGYLLESANGLGYISGNTTCSIPLSDLASLPNSASATDPTWFEYTIYDSTEGSSSTWNSTTHDITGRLSAKFRVALNVQYNDTTRPKAWITPFYWNSKTENSISWSADGVAEGHIELEGDLTDAITTALGDDPKVSGKIVVTGYAEDDIKLSELYVQFSNHTNLNTAQKASTYSNGAWSTRDFSDGWGFSAEDVYCNGDGHKVKWTLTVDTAARTTKAQLDQAIVVYAKDARNPKESEHTTTTQTRTGAETCYYKMDIVPYIKGLGTRLDDAYASNTSVFNRSANGKYPVRRGEENVKLYGFNLAGASTGVTFNSTSVGTVTAGSTSDYVTFSVPAAATSGAVSIKVNSIASLNNSNDDSKEYNKEANGINNNTLTDSRSVYVWGTTQVVTDGTVRYPTFRIGKDSNQTMGFTYDSGAQSYKMYSSTTASTNNDFVVDYSFTQWYQTAVAIDKNGKIYGVSQNGDSGGTGEQTYDGNYANSYFYGWNTKASPDSVRIYNSTYRIYSDKNPNGQSYSAYSTGTKKVAIESTWNGRIFNGERVKSPKIATGSNGNCYLVYYDSSDEKITFRYGTVTTNNGVQTFSGALTNHGTARGSAAGAQTIVSGTSAGEYAAVGVIPTGVTGAGTAVVCWYDTAAHALKYKYNTDPTKTTWSSAITIDSDYAGEYCDLAVDAAGGIHMAYFRAGGKLKYAYLSSYNDDKADVCTVDSFLSVGTNISIETSSKTISYTENGTTKTRYVPYISYFTDAIKMAKVAWPVTLGSNTTSKGTNTFTDGTVNDMFTGSWEVQVIPTNLATTLLDYTIGVGEKKKDGTNQSVMLGYGTKAGLETALLY